MSRPSLLCFCLLLFLLTRSNPPLAKSGGSPFGSIERISVSSAGTQGNGPSEWPAVSSNGRYITFHSDAPNLVPNDTNGTQDIFLYDRLTRTTERIGLGIGGVQGNGRSSFAEISGSGRYITFHSEASNLVLNDTNNSWDIYFYDHLTGELERVSVASNGQEGNAFSIFPGISDDGRFITFYSQANNLDANDTNGFDDIFLHDRQTGTTERISLANGGVQGNGPSAFPDMSADGRYIVYESDATNLVPNDTNGVTDVFIYDRINETTQRVSLNSAEQQGDGKASYAVISDNDRYITYVSYAANIDPADPNANGDIYVRDRIAGTTQLVSPGLDNAPSNGDSHYPVLSANGRFVAYHSDSSNLVPGDTNNMPDIFVYDRQMGTLRRISLSATGSQTNNPSHDVSISGNGRFLAFQSQANNLVPSDTNGAADIFLYIDLPFHANFPAFFR